jgi:hypothetical protein
MPVADDFQITMWTLCAFAALFLASRVALRVSTKGRLMVSDYILIASLSILFTASGLLHSVLSTVYSIDRPATYAFSAISEQKLVPLRLTAAMEMLWIAIYCVKLCFLAQFKFYKPPYAYVNVHLTRHYWATVCLCSTGFLFTLSQPIVLCPNPG